MGRLRGYFKDASILPSCLTRLAFSCRYRLEDVKASVRATHDMFELPDIPTIAVPRGFADAGARGMNVSGRAQNAAVARKRLGDRVVVFVGLMGAGKTAIGRKLAQMLDLPFVDSDHEIETVSRMSIPELFERYGEPEFRALEQRVIERLLREGPRVVSTGGGAFVNAQTRAAIAEHGVSIWLKADLDLLMERVAKKQNRPLLKNPDPRAVMRQLMNDRYPIYALADITVETRDTKRETIAEEAFRALDAHLEQVSGTDGGGVEP